MNGDVYKLSEQLVFGKAAWAEQMPWIVQKHSQAELRAKIQAGETLQFQRGTETVSFVPSLNRQEFSVHITGKPQPSPLAVRPIEPSHAERLAALLVEMGVPNVDVTPEAIYIAEEGNSEWAGSCTFEFDIHGNFVKIGTWSP